MPIYEYRCQQCRRTVTIFQRSFTPDPSPRCDHCGSPNLQRLISRVTVVRSMQNLSDDFLSRAEPPDESDPRAMARWMRDMGHQMGQDLGPEFDEMTEKMEAGDMPQDLEEDGDEDLGHLD